MKLGVLLPTFRNGAIDAFDAAALAVDTGLNGVFAYDHLWPMGSPQRPSLAPFPLLAAIAERHEDLIVGPLVARIGLVATSHLLGQFATLESLAPGRVIAALGTGDKLSAAENEAYDIDVLAPERRRDLLLETATALTASMPVWIGAGSAPTNDIARVLGVALNVWDATPERVRELATGGEVTWAGPGSSDVRGQLSALRDAGATWVVFAPQVSIAEMKLWREHDE